MAAFVCGCAPAVGVGGSGRRGVAAAVSRRRCRAPLQPPPPPAALAPPRRAATLFMRAGSGGGAAGGAAAAGDDGVGQGAGEHHPPHGGPDGEEGGGAAGDGEGEAVSQGEEAAGADADNDDATSTTARSGGSSGSDSEYDSDELSDYPSSSSRDGRSDGGSRDSEFEVTDAPAPSVSSALARLSRLAGGSGDTPDAPPPEETNELVKFVQSVPPPELMRRFKATAPAEVQSAMRQTLTSMLGSLPAHAFETSVRTATANLVQLMGSLLLSGYLIRNAQYRHGLLQSLATPSRQLAGGTVGAPAEPRIEGGVAVFAHPDGTTTEVPMAEYVAELRSEVALLRGELTRTAAGSNPLVAFMASMEPANLSALTAEAGDEVMEAMRKIVQAVVAREGLPSEGDAVVESGVVELGSLLFWLLVTGYFLREGEVRLQLKRSLDGADGRGLLEGELP